MLDRWIPKRAMFITAHPDDVDYSTAGTAAKWVSAGCEVIYLVLTDGSAGSHQEGMTREKVAQLRRAEQEAAAEVVGATCIFLGHADGLLQPTLELRKEVVRLIRQHRPQAVVTADPRTYFVGDTYINHPDHRAAAQIAVEAVFPAAEMDLLYPDLLEQGLTGHKVNYVYVYTRDDPNCYVDVSDVIDLKIEALRQHRSQLGDRDPDRYIRQRQGEIGKEVGCEYAEPFRRMTLKPIHGEGQ
jgi:LmbE family N-acetylglucosaminyl deacetylase